MSLKIESEVVCGNSKDAVSQLTNQIVLALMSICDYSLGKDSNQSGENLTKS